MITRNFRSLGVFVVLAIVSTRAHADDPREDLRRLASILDYVASDYSGAVKDGKILDDGEYKEQLSFVHDAELLAQKLPPGSVDPVAGVAEITKLVNDKAEPAALAEAARGLRRRLLDAAGMVMAPSTAPSKQRGAELFQQYCTPCHGAHGGGDGPAGATLKPPPRSFRDPAVMAELSPSRAFNALTDGVKGTGMQSWGILSPPDRWALAFHVFTLRWDDGGPRRRQSMSLATLAESSDGELEAKLAELGLNEADRKASLAYLRTEAPYSTAGVSLDDSRRLLQTAMAAYEKGDADGARQAAGQAYLDGFEAHEGALRARDAELVTECEEQFLKIRNDIGAGVPVDTVKREVLQLGALLDRADATLSGAGGARVAFVSAIIVILREGVEAALLIMLLLGLARRPGGDAAASDARAVHYGWMVATAIGVATWFASAPLVKFGGARREVMEGVVSLIAAVALLATGHFVLARLDAKHRVDALKKKLATTTRRRWALAGLAFLAVYREAFEVVLFLRAIALDVNQPGAGMAVLAGVGAGFVLLLGAVALLMKLGRRMKPGPLLATMGTLLCVLAVVLAGKGVRALQEAGVIGIRPLDLPRVEWLGVFPSLQGVAAQLVVLGMFFAIAFVATRTRRAAI